MNYTGINSKSNGRDRLCRPTSREPYARLSFRIYTVGKLAGGGQGNGKEKNRLPPFVAILKEMLQSEAWGSISNPARVAYIHLKSKCVSANNDEITLSFKEMERIMDRHTFSRLLRLFRKRNYYRFTEQWKSFRMKKAG
jgi:hypothetical protein